MGQGIRLSDVQWDSNGQTIVWLEGRSSKGVLVAAGRDEAPRDLTSELSVRAQVGYGGGDFTVGHGHVIFVADGRLYKQALTDKAARPITPSFGYSAAPAVSPDGRWTAFIHSHQGKDTISIVDVEGREGPKQLITGGDFYMQLAWHPNGDKLAFITWNHPQMPWDGTELRLASINPVHKGLPDAFAIETLAGGTNTSVFQPSFSPDGRLLAYVSDEDKWGQIYLYDVNLGEHHRITDDRAEYAKPAWVQGMRTLAWRWDSRVIFALRNSGGCTQLWGYNLDGTGFRPQSTKQFSGFETIASSPTDDSLALIASATTIPPCVITLSPSSGEDPQTIFRSRSTNVIPTSFSTARSVSWKGTHGAHIHGLYYLPDYKERNSELPPAVVFSHGGPTSQHTMSFDPSVQFFTTRGYVVLQVNYRGSTGYGRDYMLHLRGGWGEIDRQDVVSGAEYLVENGLADPHRLVVMGGSAGGTTVLLTLIHNPGLFKVGVCSYAVSNMFEVATCTHKFEKSYMDTLIGPLPEFQETYQARSAIFHADKIRDALIIFQGSEDHIVQSEQSDRISEALHRNAIPHEYHLFEGEGHGWRKIETIEAYYAALEVFLKEHIVPE